MFPWSNDDFEHSRYIDLVFLLLLLNVYLLFYKIGHNYLEICCNLVQIVKSFKKGPIGFSYKPLHIPKTSYNNEQQHIDPKTALNRQLNWDVQNLRCCEYSRKLSIKHQPGCVSWIENFKNYLWCGVLERFG